jgi:hypothetical protein
VLIFREFQPNAGRKTEAHLGIFSTTDEFPPFFNEDLESAACGARHHNILFRFGDCPESGDLGTEDERGVTGPPRKGIGK